MATRPVFERFASFLGGIRILDLTEVEHDVLVVDDDVDIASLVVFLLEARDLEVRTASNGQQGYEHALQLRPRLILSDLMRPVMRGDALHGALKANELTAGIAFLLMTGVPGNAPKSIETVVGKPIDLDALETILLDRLEKES